MTFKPRRVSLIAVGLLAALLLAGCGDGDGADADGDGSVADRGKPVAEAGDLTVYGPYVPAPPSDVAALYLVVVNSGDQADRLIGVSSESAGSTMLHQTVVDGDTARMTMVEGGVEVPAHGELVLEPGGYHFMLGRLVEPLRRGDTVRVALEFERAGVVSIDAPVADLPDVHIGDDDHDD